MCTCVHVYACVHVCVMCTSERCAGLKLATAVGESAPGADWLREKVPEGWCDRVKEFSEGVRMGF